MRSIQFLGLALASITLGLLSACAEPDIETWDVAADRGVCDHGSNVAYCGHYQVVGTNEGGAMYQGVDGFQAEWGHSYRIKVERTELDEAPTDGYAVSYELVEVLSDEVQPNLEFSVQLLFDWGVELTEGGGDLEIGHSFTCTPDQCTELAALRSTLDYTKQIRATFRFGTADQLFPLELISFELVDS